MLNSSMATAGGAVCADGHDGKVHALNAGS
jgi:hypothetical protein